VNNLKTPRSTSTSSPTSSAVVAAGSAVVGAAAAVLSGFAGSSSAPTSIADTAPQAGDVAAQLLQDTSVLPQSNKKKNDSDDESSFHHDRKKKNISVDTTAVPDSAKSPQLNVMSARRTPKAKGGKMWDDQ